MRLIYKIIMVIAIGFIGQSAIENRAFAQTNDGNLQRFFHYPYYYFPHNYWPAMGPKWPERPGQLLYATTCIHGESSFQRAPLAL